MTQSIRRSLFAVLAAGVLALGACGDAPSQPDPAGAGDGDADAAPYREQIEPARTAKVAKRTLPKRDTPLAVGAEAPAFDALPAGKTAVVVFYRGHW